MFFGSNIGYKNPNKKKDLEVEINRKNNKRTIKTMDTTKKEITHYLDTPKTIKELSALIAIQPSIIRKHIKKLEREGYVKVVYYQKYKVPLWIKIKDYVIVDDIRKLRIINMLKNNTLSTLTISKKIGIGKDRILTYMHELKNTGKINYLVKGRTYMWFSE